ncbi:MAG: hypothetical protein HC767_05870 [Akkermansiaceae bacterium]|nr:hypothetical protein [Akkermansiaceae bacterium]
MEKSKVVTGDAIAAGDVLMALPSSGVHSNGFSLVRKVLERAGLTVNDTAPWDSSTTAGESLLTPTVLYVNDMLAVHNGCGFKGAVHITGGGFYENIPRVLPKTLGCVVDSSTWKPLPVFQWLQEAGRLLKCYLSKDEATSHMICSAHTLPALIIGTAAEFLGGRASDFWGCRYRYNV